MHEMLRTLVSNYFVDPSDSDWINCRRIQQLVVHCINLSVERSKSIQDVMSNDVLLTVWRQLCRDPKALEFVKYLYKDLL